MQPYRRRMALEVRIGSERRPAGSAYECREAVEDIAHARRALAELVAEGGLFLRREIFYKIELHYGSREEWSEFLAWPKARELDADADLIERALSSAEGRIVLTERDVAGAYIRGRVPG